MLADLAEQVRAVVDEPDDDARRLFPPAYEDPDRQRSFVGLTRDDLVTSKRAACERVIGSIRAGVVERDTWRGTLDDEAAHAWLSVLNDARLVLGTRLDVREDMDHVPLPGSDTRAPAFNLYLYLGALQEELIEALLPGVVVSGDDDGR
jgi:hypothetical protein